MLPIGILAVDPIAAQRKDLVVVPKDCPSSQVLPHLLSCPEGSASKPHGKALLSTKRLHLRLLYLAIKRACSACSIAHIVYRHIGRKEDFLPGQVANLHYDGSSWFDMSSGTINWLGCNSPTLEILRLLAPDLSWRACPPGQWQDSPDARCSEDVFAVY